MSLICRGTCDTKVGILTFKHHAGMQSDGMEKELWTHGGQKVEFRLAWTSGCFRLQSGAGCRETVFSQVTKETNQDLVKGPYYISSHSLEIK